MSRTQQALPLNSRYAGASVTSSSGASMLDATEVQPTAHCYPTPPVWNDRLRYFLAPALEELATTPLVEDPMDAEVVRAWCKAESWCRRNLNANEEIFPLEALTLDRIRRRPNAYCSVQTGTLQGERIVVTWLDATALSTERHPYMRVPSLLELVENGVVNHKRAGLNVATLFAGVILDMPRIGLVTRFEGVSLKRFLAEYPDVIKVDEHRLSMMEQLAKAVEHLHSPHISIFHRDITEDSVVAAWEFETVSQDPQGKFSDIRPVVRLRLSHFIHSRRLDLYAAADISEPLLHDPCCGPRLHFMAPEEFNVPSNHPRQAGFKADIWKLGLIFRQLHALPLNVKTAADEYDLWVETHRLVPVRYGKQEAEYITPLPKLVNAMGSLLADGRWSATQVHNVLLRPTLAHHLPHPPLGLLRSVPDATTQYPRYDPVVQKIRAGSGFAGGDCPLQPAVLVVPHLGHVWSATPAPSHRDDKDRCKVCAAVFSSEDPNAKYVCSACGYFHNRKLIRGTGGSPPEPAQRVPPVVTSSSRAARISHRHSFTEPRELSHRVQGSTPHRKLPLDAERSSVKSSPPKKPKLDGMKRSLRAISAGEFSELLLDRSKLPVPHQGGPSRTASLVEDACRR